MLRLSNYIPNPIYYQHPTVTGDFYSWVTYGMHKPLSSHNKKQLDTLVEEWGICIHHSYPARAFLFNPCWRYNKNNEIVINEEFDSILKTMAWFKDKKIINFTTIEAIMQYWLQLKNIKFEFDPTKECVRIHNLNEEKVCGLSLCIQSDNVYINGQHATYKKIDKDLIIWFDLEGKTYTTISDCLSLSLGSGKSQF